MLHKLTRPWQVERSVLLATAALIGVAVYATRVSRDVIGPNAGYYEIATASTTVFVGVHLVVAVTFAGIGLYNRYRKASSRSLEKWMKRAAIGVVVIGAVEALWLIPNGSHVIVM